MVKVALKISCTLENINQISTSGPDFQWNLKLQCRNCNETDKNWHAITETDEVSGNRGPGSFNFQIKCKFCSSVSTIGVIKDSVKPLKSSDGDSIIKQTLVIFDCRGVEPIEFDPQDGWVAKCDETGSIFSEVEFGDGMWAGYDEKGNFPVSIDEFKGEFVRA